MSVIAPFAPHYTRGQVVAPAAASASIKIGLHKKSLCLTNLGTNVCYVRVSQSDPLFPNADISASTADYPVLPGAQVVVSKPTDTDTLSFISAAGTSLHVISGEGF